MADVKEYRSEIRDALDNIVCYLGLDRKMVNDVTLQKYMEWFIKRCEVKTGLSELHNHGDLNRQVKTWAKEMKECCSLTKVKVKYIIQRQRKKHAGEWEDFNSIDCLDMMNRGIMIEFETLYPEFDFQFIIRIVIDRIKEVL